MAGNQRYYVDAWAVTLEPSTFAQWWPLLGPSRPKVFVAVSINDKIAAQPVFEIFPGSRECYRTGSILTLPLPDGGLMFINQRWFDMPEYRTVAEGGIIAPTRFELVPVAGSLGRGIRIVRFGGAYAAKDGLGTIGNFLPHLAAVGNWWIEYDQYQIALAYQKRTGGSLSDAMAKLLCIPPVWGDLSVRVESYVSQPILAWRGEGRTIHMNGVDYTGDNPFGDKIKQLYIPGMQYEEVNRSVIQIGNSFTYPRSDALTPRGPDLPGTSR